jgi:quercetin dioxygenase-like cupin family protein
MPEMRQAVRYRWEDLPSDHPIDKLDRKRIAGERFMIAEVVLHEGCRVASHAHENEQIAIVMSGRIRFTLGAGEARREVELGAGEVLHLPPSVPHGAEALEDTRVIDVFSPVSEGTGIDAQRSS